MMDKITATKTRLESKVQFLISELPLPSGEVAPTARVRAHASSSILTPHILLASPCQGEAAARPRAAGEGPNLRIPQPQQNLRRNRQLRRRNVPHPNPLPSWGVGTRQDESGIWR